MEEKKTQNGLFGCGQKQKTEGQQRVWEGTHCYSLRILQIVFSASQPLSAGPLFNLLQRSEGTVDLPTILLYYLHIMRYATLQITVHQSAEQEAKTHGLVWLAVHLRLANYNGLRLTLEK